MATEEAPAILDERCTTAIDLMISAHRIDPWCALCRAPRELWTFETVQITGRTLESVTPALRASEAEQRLSAGALRNYQKAARN